MKTILILLSLFILLTFSNCATIVSKTKYPFSITTNPTGAQVLITRRDGVKIFSGNTPATVVLKSGSGYFKNAKYIIKISKEGFEEKTININSTFNGWYIGNLVFGGYIGMLIVDPLTGAMYKFKNPFISETLVQKSSSNKNELKILDLNDIPQDLRSTLIKIN